MMSDRLEERLYLSVPHMSEASLRYVQEAFATNWLTTMGPNLVALEEAASELVGCSTVGISSGTAGLHLALRLVGVEAGDEVVTPSLSFAASANPICYQGATPVFMDSDEATWNLDPNLLERFLKKRAEVNRLPKAVMVVHLFGQPAAMDEVLEICQSYELPVIEDAAESLGARYHGRHPGTLGDVGIFSFNGNKMITGTTGGMLVTAREGWAEKAKKWSQQALDADPEGVKNYVHSELGYNYRMSNVIAGIVRGQFEVLGDRVAARRAVFDRYVAAFADLPGWEPQPEAEGCLHSRWLSCFTVDEAAFGMSAYDVIRFLETKNVESRPVWRPMHLQPLYESFEMIGGEVAETLNRTGICLPSSSSLTEEEQNVVIELVKLAGRRGS
ncbi:MAG: aminotransferase class I/II-fold pyridoxal phosphate-dependent enzyme [Verrucomicrobiales bacterium]|nr:aminotransferase class I/II-fold pyridoxal phosphate-dependent enzyme [Verrucomicrobiales bacterium]